MTPFKINQTREIHLTRTVEVDAEIAEEIIWLNEQGVVTESSCSGHGKWPPTALICPSSVEKAKELGYEPKPYHWDFLVGFTFRIFRFEAHWQISCWTGLFEIELRGPENRR